MSLRATFQLCLSVWLIWLTVSASDNTMGVGRAYESFNSPKLCVQLCKLKTSVNTCTCPPAEVDPCASKICRRGRRCKTFGKRPVCIPMPLGCLEPKLRGLCIGEFQRFYFNPIRNRCERFIFGGCSQNRNNFFTLRACQRTCMAMSG